jgi:general secretion pathway protein D
VPRVSRPNPNWGRRFALFLTSALLCGALVVVVFSPRPTFAARAHPRPASSPTPNPPVVLNFNIISAARAASILRSIYPGARITVDSYANAVIVVASGYQEEGMRTIASGIDVKNPTDTTVDAYQLKVITPETAASRLTGVFPSARILVAPNRSIIIMASPADMGQIKSIVTTIDTAPATPSPRPQYPAEAVRVTQRNAKQIARAVAAETPKVRVAVSGSEILLSGPQDEVDHAKQLVSELDVPQMGSQTTEVYRLRYVDSKSVADLFRRSYPTLQIAVDEDLNAITITTNVTLQKRLADAVAQLDVAPQSASGAPGSAGGGPGDVLVIPLKAAVPGLQGGPSTSATDMAQFITQMLGSSASDLHVGVPPNSTSIVLMGSPYSVKLAKDLIEQLDKPQPLVALDTEVLEVDEGSAKQLGLKFTPAALTTTFSEIPPIAPPATAANPFPTTPPITGLLPWARTTLSLNAELDFLISTNKARILEDPRITTVSGRTASLRAGETVNILTTTGGGTGTVATTQVQSFQTGVTLDITPVVNDGDYITVTLHPSVNTEAGVNASTGVPNIQTRDTTTTVGLHDGETIVIGGLIEEEDSRSVQKIPLLGDLPLIGRFFQNTNVTHTRNELIVTVTPHIVRPGESGAIGVNRLGIPKPESLPTLPPGTILPPARRAPHPQYTPQQREPNLPPEPEPVTVATPMSGFTPAPGYATPQPLGTAAIPISQPTGNANMTPQPLPSQFSQTNVYTFGSAPANNYAAPNQPPQIFFAQVSPSVVKNAQEMTISAITTTNVAKLEFGPNKIVPMTSLKSVGPGQWQGTFPFSSAGLPIGQPSVQLLLTATTGMGATVTVPVPISVISP